MGRRGLAGLSCVLLLAVACSGDSPAAFEIVKSHEGRCGVFTTCYDVTIRNVGDTPGTAVCSLSQWRRGHPDPRNSGPSVTSSSVGSGEQIVVTLSIRLDDHKGYTPPRPDCEPGVSHSS